MNSAQVLYNNNNIFSDSLRADARAETSLKTAFNNYFIRDINMRNDGGFILNTESMSEESNSSNPFNRWDYLYNSPYFNRFYSPFEYNSPFMFPGYYYNAPYRIDKYYSDNIVVASFSNSGKLEWSNVVHKSQQEDNGNELIGFGMFKTNNQIHYLFNLQERNQFILNHQSMSSDGQLTRNPALKTEEKGYEFISKRAKQTGLNQVFSPCLYQSQICFAKIDF